MTTWTRTQALYGRQISIDQIASLNNTQVILSQELSDRTARTLLLTTDQDHWQCRQTDIHTNYTLGTDPVLGTYNDKFIMALTAQHKTLPQQLVILASSNGIDWHSAMSTASWHKPQLVHQTGPEELVVVCWYSVYIVKDSTVWAEYTLPQNLAQLGHMIVDANVLNNTLVIVSSNDTEHVLTHVDLTTGQTTQTPSPIPAHSIRTSATQMLLISDTGILYSDDTQTWHTPLGLAHNTWQQGQHFNDAIYANNRWYWSWTKYANGMQDGYEVLIAQNSGLLISDNATLTKDTLYSETDCPLTELSKLAADEASIYAINTQEAALDNFVAILS